MAEWMPIETAPKDGARILLYCPDALGESVTCGAFNIPAPDRDFVPHPSVEGAFVLAEVNYPGGWVADLESYVEPTHWMWLPGPPSSSAEFGGLPTSSI
jgi:hypothetical protein